MRAVAIIAVSLLLVGDPQEVITRLREAWARQDAGGVVAGAIRVVVQLPGEPATAPLSAEQAARALERLFRDTRETGLELEGVRSLGNETVYAEMLRHFRVRGSDGEAVQRVFAAFRLDGTQWRLVELRISVPGQ